MAKSKDMLDEACQRLVQAVDSSTASKELQHYLKAMARFHRYSWWNSILIWLQKPDATLVAGYRKWQELGRQVRRGEKGIVISAPVIRKQKKVDEQPDAEQPDAEQPDEVKVLRFRDVYVFDVSQTDGDALPEVPQWWANRPADEHLLLLKSRIKAAIERDGINISCIPDLRGVRGASLGGKILILDGDQSVGSLSTLVHEWTHELQRRNKEGGVGDRAVAEVVAEATAYVVLNYFGIEIPENGNYIALWSKGDATLVRHFLHEVKKYSDYILKAVESGKQ
ncbi:MAG: ArdC family protein [Chloroflexota bacterium]